MKRINYLTAFFLLLILSAATAQNQSSVKLIQDEHKTTLTIEPAIGMNPSSLSNVLVSNIVQWDLQKHLSVVSYTSYAYNNAFLREFNHIRTDYNNSFSQKFGIGTSLHGKHSSHSFSLLAGIKYDSFKETLDNPEYEPVSISVNTVSPDLGLMYNWKMGRGKYFFSYRMYLPLAPYPFGSEDVLSLDGNLANITMEFGVGIRLQ